MSLGEVSGFFSSEEREESVCITFVLEVAFAFSSRTNTAGIGKLVFIRTCAYEGGEGRGRRISCPATHEVLNLNCKRCINFALTI